MSPQNIQLVRQSFALVAPVARQAAAMFYDRVFEREPSAVALFQGDMAQQGERLMAIIAAAVAGLDDLPALERTLAELGRRHVGYGVRPAHYDMVGGALLDTLAAALGPGFTPAHRRAWARLYEHLSRCMQPLHEHA